MSDDSKELFDQDPDLKEDFGGKEWPFSGTGGLDDVPMPTGTVCLQLSNVLGRANEHSGDFSFGGQADQLPAVPGMFVEGVGPIPVPLWEERAQKLIEKCEKSPFGHNFDTKFDENVRKSWQLEPDQVQLKNQQWETGIKKMMPTIADRLGYKDIPLECVLYKLLVYEEGGHFAKHQDTEKEDGMIATLVIQPPSLHEGGDLLVYANGEVKHRHDFGKSDGTATHMTHYAVHYADAEHVLEKVTKGYRLVLVYSICLPANVRHLERNPNKPMAGELAKIIETMEDGDNSFALLLSHEYTDKSLNMYGSESFKGVDRARYLALEEANASVSKGKKLEFLIAKLYHNVIFYGNNGNMGDWDEESRCEKLTWYTIDGDSLEEGDRVPVKFNFLNPTKNTYAELWKKPYGSSDMTGYMGNQGPEKNSVYSRFAIVAWPVAVSDQNLLNFVNLDSVIDKSETPDMSTLHKLMETAAAKVVQGDEILVKLKKKGLWTHYDPVPVPVTLSFCKTLFEWIVNYSDPTLVNTFFRVFFARLREKFWATHYVADVLKKYHWSDIGPVVLAALTENDDDTRVKAHPEYFMDLVVLIAKELSRGEAQLALVKLAVEKTEKLEDAVLSSPAFLDEFWKLVVDCGEENVFVALFDRFKLIKPRLLGKTASIFSKLLNQVDLVDVKKAGMGNIIDCRLKWLASQIRVLEKPFTWEMPVAEFPDNAQIETFLKSSDESMSTKGVVTFETDYGACDFALKYTYKLAPRHKNASFDMKASTDGTFVTISKTRGWYDEFLPSLPYLKKELQNLRDPTADYIPLIN